MGKHLENAKPDIISKRLIVSGSPERIRKILRYLDNSMIVSESRGYLLVSGYYNECFISACSVGIGGPSIAIVLEELIQMGCNVVIRVGSCGVFKEDGKPGDIFISKGAVRHDGTSQKYLPLEFPAIPDFELTEKLIETSKLLSINCKVGLGSCNDVFYKPYQRVVDKEKRFLMEKINVLFGEMETSTFFCMGLYHNIKTAAILVSDSSRSIKKDDNNINLFSESEDKAIQVALKTLETIQF